MGEREIERREERERERDREREIHINSVHLHVYEIISKPQHTHISGVGNEEAPGGGAHPSSWPSQ